MKAEKNWREDIIFATTIIFFTWKQWIADDGLETFLCYMFLLPILGWTLHKTWRNKKGGYVYSCN